MGYANGDEWTERERERERIASVSRQREPTWNPPAPFFRAKTSQFHGHTGKERMTRVQEGNKCLPPVGLLMMIRHPRLPC